MKSIAQPALSKTIARLEEDLGVPLFETGEVDLCFTASSLEHPGVRELAVLDAEVFLVVPPGHYLEVKESVRLADVADEPFIEYKAGHPFRKINETFCLAAGIRPRIVCEVERPSYPMLRIESPECRRVFSVAWLERRYLSEAARRFQQFLSEYYSEA